MPRTTDKRNRLVDAAKVLIHQQGFSQTTLADIANKADVPLGNVYYYFKTKAAIGVAVIELIGAQLRDQLANWSQHPTPLARLKSFVEGSIESLDMIARYGCSIGGLCQELGKQGGPLADLAAKLLHDIINWAEDQFTEMGHTENAAELAVSLVASLQGVFVLTHTFKDPKVATKHVEVINTWLAKQEKATTTGVQQPEIA